MGPRDMAGMSVVVPAVKWMGVVAAVAIVVAGGFAGYTGKPVSAESTVPAGAADSTQITTPAVSGLTGAISGRVSEGTITSDIMWKLAEMMLSPNFNDEARKETEESIKKMTKPVPDVEVVLGEYEEEGFGRKLRSLRSDESGNYEFAEVPAGRYSMRVIAPPDMCLTDDGAPDKVRKVEVKAGETKTENFTLKKGVGVRGTVTDHAARPVEGAEVVTTPIVTVFMDQNYARVERKSRVSTLSEADGTYAIGQLIPAGIKNAVQLVRTGQAAGGVVEITARAKGYASSRIFMHAVTPALVIDAKALTKKYESLPQYRQQQQREENPSAPASIPLAACEGDTFSGINLRLEPESVIAGTLVTSMGRPVPKVKLKLRFKEEEPPLNPALDAQHEGIRGETVYFVGKPFKQYRVPPEPVETDEQGLFTFESLSAGEYMFEVEWDEVNIQQARNEPLNVDIGQRLADIKVIIEDPNERLDLYGIVVDAATRQPLKNFRVWQKSIEAPGEKSPRSGLLRMEQGKPDFSITGISPGTVVLNIEHEGYGTENFKIDVKREAGHEVMFPLTKEAKIEGCVTLNGEPKETQVSARRVDSDECPYAGSDKNTGEYVIRGLRPGEYMVFTGIWIDGPTSTQRGMHQRVIVESGKIARADFDFVGSAAIHGILIWPKSLPRNNVDAFVSVYSGTLDEFPERGSRQSIKQFTAGAWDFRSSDEYRISTLPAGEYTVVARLAEKKGEKKDLDMKVRHVTLREGEMIELEIDFSDYACE